MIRFNKSYPSKLVCILFLSIVLSVSCHAQDLSFENGIDTRINAENNQLSNSTLHYKDGSQSLKWAYLNNEKLTFNNLSDLGLNSGEVWDYHKNFFRCWVYNTQEQDNQVLNFTFYDNNNIAQFSYDINLNFKGWRAATTSYRYEMLGNKSNTDLTKLVITAPNASGTLFFDYIDFTTDRITPRAPDKQLPHINQTSERMHWEEILYYESLSKTATPADHNAYTSAINDIKNDYDTWVLGASPNTSGVQNAMQLYNNLGIQINNGNITGKPLFGMNFSKTENIALVEDFIYILARDYKHNNNQTSLNACINTIKHLLDQGYAYGSLMESASHIGYEFREIPKAIFLLEAELKNENIWQDAFEMISWYTATEGIWDETAALSNMDDGNTRTLHRLGVCLYQDTNEKRVQYLLGFKTYLQRFLTPTNNSGEGFKTDYTGFHHNTFYPGYSYYCLNSVSQALNFINKSELFEVNNTEQFKQYVRLARIVSGDKKVALSISGRNPFSHPSINNSLYHLSKDLNNHSDFAAAYNYLNSPKQHTLGIDPETVPNGFWQVNSSNMGAYRQNNWVAVIKGFDQNHWGSEIYSTANRYGRYQSYGALELLFDQPEKSFMQKEGWDWNHYQGTTSIKLSWDDLLAENIRQDEKTDKQFAGALRINKYDSPYLDSKLEGEMGLFGFSFKQKNISTTHNDSFKFKKSYFCFDGKILCLGSDINVQNNNNPVVTTLYQVPIALTSDQTVVNGQSYTGAFENSLTANQNQVIKNTLGTYYFVKNSPTLTIKQANQTSPNSSATNTTSGDFGLAYINHGNTPSNDTYEYLIYPNLDSTQLNTFTNDWENNEIYDIIQQDNKAHIVSWNQNTALVLFEAQDLDENSSEIINTQQACLAYYKKENDTLRLSINQPYFYFDADGKAQNETYQITLKKDWILAETPSHVSQENTSNGTKISWTASYGEATDLVFVKNESATAFYYNDFGYDDNRGFTVKIVNNSGVNADKIGKRVAALPGSNSTLNNEEVFRPTHTIPSHLSRDQKTISISGSQNNTNYDVNAWIVMETIDMTSNNPLIAINQNRRHVDFWTQARYMNGNNTSLKVWGATNYNGQIENTSWTALTEEVIGNLAKADIHPQQFVNGKIDLTNYANASAFTLAFQYMSSVSPYSQDSRNGTVYISDVSFHAFESDSLNTEIPDKIAQVKLYPNPTNHKINLNGLGSYHYEIRIYNMLGKVVLKKQNESQINVGHLKEGLYMVEIVSELGEKKAIPFIKK